ncbi:response regulator [Inhella gelatinilytica]|uniref:Response regulator n=1 Tax=Inhella gelatinilytica TaxID=2795030 RepID=A0A931IXA7_9BURK|nr:response regulator [Inhella gelatinilytica]MBH9553869.1 response regulator [Inhella gelatinilytica]
MSALLSPQEARLFAATRVMTVHESDAMRRVSRALLGQLGVQHLLEAADAAQAQALLKDQRVDIVLCDWQLPGEDGLALLQALRASAAHRLLPFVLITGETDRDVLQHAVSAGASHVLVKPYNASTLADRIRRAMASAARIKPEDAVPAHSGAQKNRSTILVVDDAPENLEMLAALLRDDYQVKVAISGERALRISQGETPPDLILLDVMMPGMDGFEVARRLRAHPVSEHIPVVFVTAQTDSETRQRGLEMGAIDFVPKPIDPAQLMLRIRNFLRYVDLRRQTQAEVDSMLERAQLETDARLLASQDVRSPLATALALLQPLLERADPEWHEDLLGVEENLLASLNALHLSTELIRIESGQYTLHTRAVQLPKVLQRVVRLNQQAFLAKGLQFEFAGRAGVPANRPQASGDPLLCHTLFHELLESAGRLATPNSRITVTIADEDPIQVGIRFTATWAPGTEAAFFRKESTQVCPGYAAKRLAEIQRGGVTLDVQGDTSLLTVVLLRAAQTFERG